MKAKSRIKNHRLFFLESFICAATSALMISVAHLRPEFWFVSFLALIPFLWRATRVSTLDSSVLGVLLATSYFFATVSVTSLAAPGAFFLRFFALSAFFSFYAIAVNRMAKQVGFNAIFAAVLWLPLEYALSHYAHLNSMFTFAEADSTFLIRIASLLGMLMVSFAVVLINSLILIVLERAHHAGLSHATFGTKHNRKTYPPFRQVALRRHWYHFVDPRAPPLSAHAAT